MHFMYFENEARDFDQINKAEDAKVSKRELDLRPRLDRQNVRARIRAGKNHDEYRERFLAMWSENKKGHEITVAALTGGLWVETSHR
jgi:non-homologous end joining protein Ku